MFDVYARWCFDNGRVIPIGVESCRWGTPTSQFSKSRKLQGWGCSRRDSQTKWVKANHSTATLEDSMDGLLNIDTSTVLERWCPSRITDPVLHSKASAVIGHPDVANGAADGWPQDVDLAVVVAPVRRGLWSIVWQAPPVYSNAARTCCRRNSLAPSFTLITSYTRCFEAKRRAHSPDTVPSWTWDSSPLPSFSRYLEWRDCSAVSRGLMRLFEDAAVVDPELLNVGIESFIGCTRLTEFHGRPRI